MTVVSNPLQIYVISPSPLAPRPLPQPADIAVVKTMKNPPDGIKLVMAAICVMRDIKPDKVNDPAGTGKKVQSVSTRAQLKPSIAYSMEGSPCPGCSL